MGDRTDIPVVILCGGKGTRMWPSTAEIPKPMMEIGGKPLLWHLLKRYSHFGYQRFILCVGHLAEHIIAYFINPEHKEEHWTIEYVFTGTEATKSQRLSAVQKHITSDYFLVSYGADLSAVDIRQLVDFHLANKKIATLTSVPLYSNFGVIEINDQHEVHSFREKPRIEPYWINGGFFVFNRTIFDYLFKGELEKEVFESLAAEKQLAAYRFDGFFMGMDTAKDHQEFNQLFDSGKAPWVCWE